MPLTHDQLFALAQTRASMGEIRSALGHDPTPAERDTINRGRLVARLKRAQKKERGPMGAADRVARHMAQHSLVAWAECADPARRKRLEAVPEKWLKWYCADTFTRPFEKPHHAIIEGAIKASRTGSRFAVVGERGIGKSVLLWGIVLMLSITGEQSFPVCLPWDKGAVKRAFRFWKNALCSNDRILADYPEICAPFRHSKGISQRLASTVWSGGPNDGKATGAALAITDGLMILPDCRGCFGGVSINANPKGINHSMPDGRTIRPTLALLDDVQDRETARSIARVAYTIEIIDGDVAGMGEAGLNLPMLMSGNCIVRDDVMDHYLHSDRWQSVRIPCVESWPDGWKDGDGPAGKLWQEWHGLYRSGKGAVTFYRKHRAKMVKGMVLSAPGTFRKAPQLPDAFCGVMLTWFKMGPEAFAAEKQQAPLRQGVTIYNLTPAVICSRSTDRAPGVVPDWVRLRVAATDINPSYGLTWVLAGFGQDQTSAVIAYGIHPMTIPTGATDAETAKLIYEALVVHGRFLAGLPCRPESWIIDAGGTQFDVALRFATESGRMGCVQALPATGRGARNYKPWGKGMVGKPREQCHMASDTRGRKWLAWNADYWKEAAQRAWTGSAGAPGSCSLPTGQHREFAEQICREQLAAKAEMAGAMRWEWHRQPGPNDYLDALAMVYMGAAWGGIGTGGVADVRPARKSYRQADFRGVTT